MTEVERVARMLCQFDGGDPDTSLGGDQQNWLWHEYCRQARGLIDAGLVVVPREPTKAMLRAAMGHIIGEEKQQMVMADDRNTWQTMIAATQEDGI